MKIHEVLIESQLNEEMLTELDWSKIKKGLTAGIISLGALGISSGALAGDKDGSYEKQLTPAQAMQIIKQKLQQGEIKPAVVKQAVQKVDAAPEIKKAEPKVDSKPEVKKVDEPKKIEKPPEEKKDFKATGKWKTKSLGATDIDGPEKQIFTLESENTIKLDFPYGNTNMKLHIRIVNGKIDPDGGIFITSKGQFHSEGGYRNPILKIKIDNSPAETVGYTSPSDSSSGIAFLSGNEDYENKLLNRIANSKQIKIQIGYFQNGSQIFTFSTDGLQAALADYKLSKGKK